MTSCSFSSHRVLYGKMTRRINAARCCRSEGDVRQETERRLCHPRHITALLYALLQSNMTFTLALGC